MTIEEARLIDPAGGAADEQLDVSLRPRTLSEYVGQPALREKLGIFLEAARRPQGL